MSGARSSQRHDARQVSSVAAALARSVRSGLGLADALAEVGREVVRPGGGLATDLDVVLAAVERGARVDDALAQWVATGPGPTVELLVAACRFGHAHGGDLAAALDGAAVTLLDQADAADEARALASQARTSAVVLALLPVVGVLGFSVLDPRVAATLLTTTPGRVCLAVGAGFEGAGVWVLSRLVRGALR